MSSFAAEIQARSTHINTEMTNAPRIKIKRIGIRLSPRRRGIEKFRQRARRNCAAWSTARQERGNYFRSKGFAKNNLLDQVPEAMTPGLCRVQDGIDVRAIHCLGVSPGRVGK